MKVFVVIDPPTLATYGTKNATTAFGPWLEENIGNQYFIMCDNIANRRGMPKSVRLKFAKYSDASKFLQALESGELVNQRRVDRAITRETLKAIGFSNRKSKLAAWKQHRYQPS